MFVILVCFFIGKEGEMAGKKRNLASAKQDYVDTNESGDGLLRLLVRCLELDDSLLFILTISWFLSMPARGRSFEGVKSEVGEAHLLVIIDMQPTR